MIRIALRVIAVLFLLGGLAATAIAGFLLFTPSNEQGLFEQKHEEMTGNYERVQAATDAAEKLAKIKFRELRFGRPPLVYLYFDVVLRNQRAEPRWFLLPKSLSAETAPDASKGGVDGLEVFAPRGKGRVIVGRFLGTGGFQALLLSAGAEVRLRLFPISFWGDLPEVVQVDVITAKRLTIGGEEAESWFGVNPLSSARADVAEKLDSQSAALRSRHSADNKEVAVVFEEDRRLTLRVPLRNLRTQKLSRRTMASDMSSTSGHAAAKS